MSTLSTRVSIPEEVLFRELDDEAVILELASGRYYGLDEVGTRMWQLLRQHGCLRPVHQALLEEYQVAEDQLRRDLLEFVDDLAARKLLELHED